MEKFEHVFDGFELSDPLGGHLAEVHVLCHLVIDGRDVRTRLSNPR